MTPQVKIDRERALEVLRKLMSLSTVLFITGSIGLWGSFLVELRSSKSGETGKNKVVRQLDSGTDSHQHSSSTAHSEHNFGGKPISNGSVSRNSGNGAKGESFSEVRFKKGDRSLLRDFKTWFQNRSPLQKCFFVFTVVGLCGVYFVMWLSVWLTDNESSTSQDS